MLVTLLLNIKKLLSFVDNLIANGESHIVELIASLDWTTRGVAVGEHIGRGIESGASFC